MTSVDHRARSRLRARPPGAPLPIREVAQLGHQVLDSVQTVVVGMDTALKTALAAILAGGHVLFEDVPGLGKTLAARSLAQALGLEFRRLQCTPDLLPADITGSYVYDPAEARFVFRPGPVFTGLLLADEINRTAPKTQSALLEAMAERQVSVEGRSFVLDPPFHVMATSNPVEYEGTYPLPEAQLDRFMVRLAVGYPSGAGEADVLCSPARSTHRGDLGRADRRRRDRAADAGRGRDGRRRPGHPRLLRGAVGRDPEPSRPSRSAPRRADHWRCCWSPGRLPCWTVATSSPPRTSRRSPSPPSPTGSP